MTIPTYESKADDAWVLDGRAPAMPSPAWTGVHLLPHQAAQPRGGYMHWDQDQPHPGSRGAGLAGLPVRGRRPRFPGSWAHSLGQWHGQGGAKLYASHASHETDASESTMQTPRCRGAFRPLGYRSRLGCDF